jgi:hypothetical protein
MPKEPWDRNTVQPAFDKTLRDAVKDSGLKAKLLDPDPVKVKEAFSDYAQIEVPDNITIRFHPEEDLPFNLAVAIPAPQGNTPTVPGNPKDATFAACFLGFYNTYLKVSEFEALNEIFKAKELRGPVPSQASPKQPS